MSSWDLCRVYT